MIDLETLDTRPSAVILSVGVVWFEHGLDEIQASHGVFEVQPQLDVGRTVSASTMEWWWKQDQAARDAILNADKSHPRIGAEVLYDMLSKTDCEIWANSPAFDLVILQSFFESFGLKCPWSFRQERDLRTLKALFPAQVDFAGTKHNAMDDAVHQVREYAACLNLMRSAGN